MSSYYKHLVRSNLHFTALYSLHFFLRLQARFEMSSSPQRQVLEMSKKSSMSKMSSPQGHVLEMSEKSSPQPPQGHVQFKNVIEGFSSSNEEKHEKVASSGTDCDGSGRWTKVHVTDSSGTETWIKPARPALESYAMSSESDAAPGGGRRSDTDTFHVIGEVEAEEEPSTKMQHSCRKSGNSKSSNTREVPFVTQLKR